MKHGNFWMTTVGAGLVIAAMMAAGRTAAQNPTVLFLAGQLKVATGHTEDGMRLLNEAAAQRDSENGKVHAAGPATKPTEVCEKSSPKQPASRPAARPVAMKVSASPKAPVAILAKLETPVPVAPVFLPPAAFQYLNASEQAQITKLQVEFQKVARQRVRQGHKMARTMVLRYALPNGGINPDISNLDRELPAYLGQVAQ